MTVDVIVSRAKAAALEQEWNDLLPRAPGITPFQAPEWLLPWYDIWAADRVHVLTARDCRGTLRAIVPAVRMNGRLELAGSGVSDYLAPIVDEAGRAEAVAALDEALAGGPCLFHDVPHGVVWPGEEAGSGWEIAPASTCPAIALPSAIDAWRTSLGGGLQRNLRRYGERMAAQGARLWTVAREGELQPALDALFALHGRRWHERDCPGIFADADVRRFHRASAPRLLARGVLRLHVLSVGDAIAGVQYVLAGASFACSYVAGFDPAWRHMSPGMLLMAYAIECAIRERLTAFDLLRGTEAYKYAWGAVDRMTRSARRG